MPGSKVVIIVPLPSPVTGATLMEAVKTTTRQNGKRYHSDYIEGTDSHRMGQVSENPYEHFLVSGSQDIESIRQDEQYPSIIVSSYLWPVFYNAVNFTQGQLLQAMNAFIETLKRCLSEAGESRTSSPWPQTVKICSQCQHILELDYGRAFCPNHGKNPPSQVIQVAPIS